MADLPSRSTPHLREQIDSGQIPPRQAIPEAHSDTASTQAAGTSSALDELPAPEATSRPILRTRPCTSSMKRARPKNALMAIRPAEWVGNGGHHGALVLAVYARWFTLVRPAATQRSLSILRLWPSMHTADRTSWDHYVVKTPGLPANTNLRRRP